MDNKTKTGETGCCPRFDPKPWDEKTIIWKSKPFVRGKTLSFFHIPLNMGSVITTLWKHIESAGAKPDDADFVLLSWDPTPWQGEQLIAVKNEVKGMDNIRITGTFFTKVFEGSYGQVSQWMKDMESWLGTRGKKAKQIYMYYTTCPKCAKAYGKNYVVLLAQVD